MVRFLKRFALFLVFAATGFLASASTEGWAPLVTALVFGAIGLTVTFSLGYAIEKTDPRILLGTASGALVSAVAAAYVTTTPLFYDLIAPILFAFIFLAAFCGGQCGSKAAQLFFPTAGKTGSADGQDRKIIDTSALIDGRIAELADQGFISGEFIVPRFVLLETQSVADSQDPSRRARGRRGLGSIERIKEMENVTVTITDEDYAKEDEVDMKLVAMASKKKAVLVTTDFNLAKVAEFQGVKVLNIQALSQAMRPVVLPGDKLAVTIRKAGKEPGQGVGYMEDGTMVVVENAAHLTDSHLSTVVTSVLQTSAGKLVFAKTAEDDFQSAENKAGMKGRP